MNFKSQTRGFRNTFQSKVRELTRNDLNQSSIECLTSSDEGSFEEYQLHSQEIEKGFSRRLNAIDSTSRLRQSSSGSPVWPSSCPPSLNESNVGFLSSSFDDSSPLKTENSDDKDSLDTLDNLKFKTELCRSFDETGQCKYGHKCQFAHGPNELRDMSRHPRYKSELCRRFHDTGLCSYGARCHFLHDSKEQHLVYAKGVKKEKKKNEVSSNDFVKKTLLSSLKGLLDSEQTETPFKVLLPSEGCPSYLPFYVFPYKAEMCNVQKFQSPPSILENSMSLQLQQSYRQVQQNIQQQKLSNAIYILDKLSFV